MILSSIVIVLALVSGLLMLWRIPLALSTMQPSSHHQADDRAGAEESSGRIGLSGHPEARCSIIIPARNEAGRLPALLASLQIQDIQPFELIVVDDQSTDETAKIAREYGASVILSEQLGGGWIGKCRACWSGARAATGDWLLFLDADTWFVHADSLRRLLITFHALGGHGSLSLQPDHTVKRLYESLSTIFNIIVMAGMSVFTPFGARFKSAGLFGPCLMCNRADYFSVGGHEVIRGNVMDDLALGRSFHGAGLPVHCMGGKGVIAFRMYPEGLMQLIEGWSKNFCSAATSTHPAVFVMILLWICGGFSILTLLPVAIFDGSMLWLSFGILSYIAHAVLLIWLARRVGRFHDGLLILFPILLVFFALVFFWSMYLTKVRHVVSWRGREINI